MADFRCSSIESSGGNGENIVTSGTTYFASESTAEARTTRLQIVNGWNGRP